MTSGIWQDAKVESDGDRLVRRRASEHAGSVERVVSDLKALANISDATHARPRVIEAMGAAERLKKQLESLRDD